nr:hypothetical protein [uncultured Flavobacterium sp.]
MKINKYIIIVIILLLKSGIAISQNKTDKTDGITHFVKAVFFEKKTTKFIADNYIYFEPINNTKYTIDDRIKILNKHLKKIKTEKSPLLDLADFYVVSYNEYKGNKVVFSKGTENVFILVSKSNAIMYFSLINDRILSFDYIVKGDEGLFLTY